MDKINAALKTIRDWIIHRFSPPAVVHGGGMSDEPLWSIDDGVNYSLPLLINAAGQPLTESLTTYSQQQTFRTDQAMPYRTQADAPVFPVNEDPLREWNWSTREAVLTNCHAAYARNPLAHAAVNFTTDFVVGDGFNLSCKNPEVEKVLQEFINNPDNAIRTYERQAVRDLQVDGEIILRYFTEAGEVVAVPQRPWELHWIDTELGFFRRPRVYRFQRYLTTGDSPERTESKIEDVPADQIQFVAIGNHSYELRGKPELYRILPWLRAHKEAIEDRVRQNKWRGALLYHVQVANATPAVIASVVARWRKPPSPGSAYVSTANETVTPVTNSTNAGDASTDIRLIALMVIVGMRLPEYFFGDGSMTNLATATRQELPALTKFEAFQQLMIEQVWTPMFKRVIRAAIDAGKLPEECEEYDATGKVVYEPVEDDEPEPMRQPEPPPTMADIQRVAVNGRVPSPEQPKPEAPKMCKTEDAFEVSYEPVTAQDITALVNMLSSAVTQGWASNRTAAEKLGFDPSIEEDRIKKERQEDLTAMARGEKAIPPEMRPISDTGEEQPPNVRPQ